MNGWLRVGWILPVAGALCLAAGRPAGADPAWTPAGDYVLQARVGATKSVGSLRVVPVSGGYRVFRTVTTSGTSLTMVGRGDLSGANLRVTFGRPSEQPTWEDPALEGASAGSITVTYVFDAKGKVFGRLVNPQRIGGWAAANDAGMRSLTALSNPNPYSTEFGRRSLGPDFIVERGQLSFDAEGTEGGLFHSRRAHLPPGLSGVTIGRGYDIGQHSTKQVMAALRAAGLSESDARKFAGAAGLRGEAARTWLKAHAATLREITPAEQKKLFEKTYAEMQADVIRLADVEGLDEKFADPDLSETDAAILDVLVDMRYRGDYTGKARKKLEAAAVTGDLVGVCSVLEDRARWSNVPKDRYRRRIAYLCEREALVSGEARPGATPGR
ncbi:MAG: hypothetical protein HZA54_13290 [Planctomycetes bacterium]|nr:hypothetical protein [Planctomycetota bacterium]